MSATEHSVSRRSSSGLTLDDLASLTAEAIRADLPGDTVLRAQVSMAGRLKLLTATGTSMAPDEAT